MPHILLIDDDALLRDTLHQLLALDGHQVTEAADGHLGLERLLKGQRFDLVITDMLMPAMDGAQVITEVRRRWPQLPVIAISGGRRAISPQFNLDTAQLVGATCMLGKPFGRAALQQAVRTALGG
ncbi:response regulator [Pseudaquabacterium rugosum]|uniref:Response regulator n=1 Tax=Pseudaquabacterium rugosum TaxID=2984194 RepID=A0ABU9B7Q6_9BURK